VSNLTYRHANTLTEHTESVKLKGRSPEWLTEEEDKIVRQLSKVRSLMNAGILISHLPEEVLVKIFSCVRSLSFPSTDWISVSHVCRYWRAVALDAHASWAGDIGPLNVPFVSMCVERAGDVPLSLIWKWADEEEEEEEKEEEEEEEEWTPEVRQLDVMAVAPYVSRLVNVDIKLNAELMGEFGSYLETEAWGSLVTLALATPNRCRTATSLLPINFSFSEQPPPNLHSLRLDGVVPCFFTNSAMFRGLRTLHLMNDTSTNNMISSLETFLTVLETCTLWEDLLLRRTPGRRLLAESVTSYAEPRRAVDLSRLRNMPLFFSREIDIAYMLAHLAIPDTTHVVINRLCKRTMPTLWLAFLAGKRGSNFCVRWTKSDLRIVQMTKARRPQWSLDTSSK